MAEDRSTYSSMLGRRYGKEMSPIFSDDFKFKTWRECWVSLAEAECELGLAGVTPDQVAQLKQYVNTINYDIAEERERKIRHDVMAHVYAFGQQCLGAAGIIHAGATSCDITDNAELLQMYTGLELLRGKIARTIGLFGNFAMNYKDLACLGFTHFQPAQPTTLGKRAAQWGYNFVIDYGQIKSLHDSFKLRGLKGATGTQASFLELADGDEAKVIELNRRFNFKLGIVSDFLITGQTYPRKYDSIILGVLSGIGESAHKFGMDARILQNIKEFEEPFEKDQVGSSTMAYKRNPMRLERMCSLSRGMFAKELESRMTSSVQLFERTLDDSAARRDYIPQTFIAADEVINLVMNVMEKPAVFPRVIQKNLERELPFMATENLMMAAVKRGRDRQDIHEIIRQHSHEAGRKIKEEGADNFLVEFLAKDPRLGLSQEDIDAIMDVRKFVGRAPAQVVEFYKEIVVPIVEAEKDRILNIKSDVRV